MEQKVVYGKDSFSLLRDFVKERNGQSILLVTGKSSFEKCGAKQDLETALLGFKVTRFFDFEENPKIDDVVKGVELFNENDCDVIIAVGGGSCIDMAKLINFFKLKNQPFSDHLNGELEDVDTTPLVAIPTTAGAGSESTHFAVVYVNNIKHSIAKENLKPKFVLINSDYLKTQPKKQLIVSGLDAFCQGVESYWCVNSNDVSTKYSKEAITNIWYYLEKAVEGEDVWDKLALGAFKAGKAIDITKTTGPHSLSYGFTINYGIPHGHAVSLFLPFFIDFHLSVTDEDSNDSRGAKFVRQRMIEIAELLSIDIDSLSQTVADFFKRLGIEINFLNLYVDINGYFEALKGLNQNRLNNNPRLLSKEDLEDIYKYNLKF